MVGPLWEGQLWPYSGRRYTRHMDERTITLVLGSAVAAIVASKLQPLLRQWDERRESAILPVLGSKLGHLTGKCIGSLKRRLRGLAQKVRD